MRIEEGMMVEITAEDYKEKLAGCVGMVIERIVQEDGSDLGEEPVFRVEFFSNRIKLPADMPSYWPEGDLREAK